MSSARLPRGSTSLPRRRTRSQLESSKGPNLSFLWTLANMVRFSTGDIIFVTLLSREQFFDEAPCVPGFSDSLHPRFVKAAEKAGSLPYLLEVIERGCPIKSK